MVALYRPKETQARLARFSLPSGMAQVTVQLSLVTSESVEPLVGHLWDISETGGCIALPRFSRIAAGTGAWLQMRAPMTYLASRLEAEVRWCTALNHSTFVGVLFTGGPAPAETFLASYMRSSWTDSIPRSRWSV